MKLDASSLQTNIFVTVMVFLMVVLLPFLDRYICNRLDIDITHKRTADTREARLLRIRELVFYILFFLYFAVYVYLVFFSRTALDDYVVHVAPLQDLIHSVEIDTGFVGVISTIFQEGFKSGLSKIQIEKPEDIAQFYMNMMLFVPMGYLLPYVFDWMQESVHRRPVLFCFLISFITENLQLIFKVGFYDFDDIIANTLGGFIGQELYVRFAYIVEKPDWKNQARKINTWKKLSRKRTLFPLADSLGYSRSTIHVSSPSVVWDFYIGMLGFMLLSEVPATECAPASFLLNIGTFNLEIVCDLKKGSEPQSISLSADNLDKLKKHLEKSSIRPGDFSTDNFTHLRKLTIHDPDGNLINFLE